MKISYAVPGSSPSYTVLGDESDRTATFELFAPGFQPLNQVEPLAGGSNTFKAARGNVNSGLQIVVSKPYSSKANALAGIKTIHDALVGIKNHLKVEEGATVHYYPNALLTGMNPVLRGTTIQFNLQFVSDDLTATAPTT